MAGLDNNMLSVMNVWRKIKYRMRKMQRSYAAKMIQQKRTQRILITIKNF